MEKQVIVSLDRSYIKTLISILEGEYDSEIRSTAETFSDPHTSKCHLMSAQRIKNIASVLEYAMNEEE